MARTSILDLTARCLAHGYRTMPTAEQALRDCEIIEKEGVDVTNLLELATLLEAQELRAAKLRAKNLCPTRPA